MRCKAAGFHVLYECSGDMRVYLGPARRVAAARCCVELRGSVVIDKSFVFMALACAMAPFVGAGLYMMVVLF